MCRCSCLCETLSRSTLLIFNIVDALAGVFLVGYGIYVHQALVNLKEEDLSYIYILILSLGACLLLVALLSMCGMSFDSARCGLCVSAWLGGLLAAFELVVLIVFGALKTKSMDFLDSHREELGLSEDGLNTFKSFYTVIIWMIVGLFVLELLRFQLSKHLRQSIQLSLDEYRERLLEARHVEKRTSSSHQRRIKEKYQDKREGYINKYSKGGGGGNNNGQQEQQSYIDV